METIQSVLKQPITLPPPPQQPRNPPPLPVFQHAPIFEHHPINPQHQHNNQESMDKMRRWNVHYEGGNDAIDFLERLDELSTSYEIPRDHIIHILPDKLRGRALDWFRNNRNHWQTWDEFCTAFKNFFLPRRYRMKLQDEIRRRSQGPRERGKDYVTQLQTMFRHLGGIQEDEQLERIFDNLRTEYRLYIKRQDFDTLPELIILIEQYEELMKEGARTPNHVVNNEPQNTNPFRSRTPNTPLLPTPPPEAPKRSPHFNRRTHCWHCGETRPDPRRCKCRSGNDQRDQDHEQS